MSRVGPVTEAAFLAAVAPRLGLRPEGFRRNLGQVWKRIHRRMAAVGTPDLAQYLAYLERREDEWAALDALCRVTISRFYRDAVPFDRIREELFPRWSGEAVAWSLGCASGEEPCTLAMAFASGGRCPRRADTTLRIVGVDADPRLVERARRGRHRASALRELPIDLRRAGVDVDGDLAVVRPAFRDAIEWRTMDVRRELPEGTVDLVLCRNVVFTYVERQRQEAFLHRLRERMRPGAWLVIGREEALPPTGLFEPIGDGLFAVKGSG